MISTYRKEQIVLYAEHFSEFFKHPVKPSFYGSNALDNLFPEEKEYFESVVAKNLNNIFDLQKWLNDSLTDTERVNFVLFLLTNKTFTPDLNVSTETDTVFSYLVKALMKKKDKKDFMQYIHCLYKKGYQSKPADLLYLRNSYAVLKNEYECLAWSLARFAYKLNNADLIKKAFDFHMPLLTIASFKMRRPFGINYPNLLGIANSALQNYRSQIELIIHAMETYDVFYDIEKRDHKKTFKQRMEDYYITMPPQDPDIAEVAFLLFPELSETNNIPNA